MFVNDVIGKLTMLVYVSLLDKSPAWVDKDSVKLDQPWILYRYLEYLFQMVVGKFPYYFLLFQSCVWPSNGFQEFIGRCC